MSVPHHNGVVIVPPCAANYGCACPLHFQPSGDTVDPLDEIEKLRAELGELADRVRRLEQRNENGLVTSVRPKAEVLREGLDRRVGR